MTLLDSIAELVGRKVVLDTAGPVFYLGTLTECTPAGFWLCDVDVHNENDGHAGKELYILEAGQHGIRANRQRAFVLQSAVISLSALEDAQVV
jgi:hypothetical protein